MRTADRGVPVEKIWSKVVAGADPEAAAATLDTTPVHVRDAIRYGIDGGYLIEAEDVLVPAPGQGIEPAIEPTAGKASTNTQTAKARE